MKEFFARYPLLVPLLVLCLGILQGFSLHLGWGWVLLIWCLTGVCSFFFRPSFRAAAWVLCLFLLFLLGWFRAQGLSRPALPSLLKIWITKRETKPVLLVAHSFCQSQGERSYFDGDLLGFYEGETFYPMHASLRWHVGSPQCPASPGVFYRSRGRFRLPNRYQNPSSFDYPAYLAGQGIAATASIGSSEELVPLRENDSWIFTLRRSGLDLLQRARLAPEVRQTLLGLFWGVRPTEDSGLIPMFRDTGLAHLLVVSGFHFTLIFGIFFFLLRGAGFFFGAWGDRGWVRKGAMGLALLPAILFGFWVGPGPPVLRALAAVILLVLVYWIDSPRDFLSLGLLVALGMLLWWPPWLFDPSFLLSFGAVFTLILFSRRMVGLIGHFSERRPKPLIRFFGYLFIAPLATVAVNGVLYPLMAYYFHRISWVAPLANGLTEPLFSLILMPGLLLATLLGPLWGKGAVTLIEQLGMVTAWSLDGLRAMAEWDWAAVWVGPPRWWIWLPWSLGLALFFRAKRRGVFLAGVFLLSSLGLFDLAFSKVPPSGLLKLSVLDVGQGDAHLLELPDGSALLVDGGGIPYGDFDIGEKVVLPELLRRGIRELRAMVLTHPDGDHALGLISLARHLKVREFWTAAAWSSLAEVPELKKILKEKNIPIRTLDDHQSLFAAHTSFEVLWPPQPERLRGQDLSRNDQSLVLRICYQKVCLLLTGDLEARGESLLLQELQKNRDVKSQVLKVGHHGSRTSSSPNFLLSVEPQLALISAGKDNRFGMPHREVLQRLEESGVKWFSTERDGQIHIQTDGKKIIIERAGSGLGSVLALPIPSY